MAIVTRASVGRELTYAEMDANLDELDFRAGYFSDTFFTDIHDENGSWTLGDALPSFTFPDNTKAYMVNLGAFDKTTNYFGSSGTRTLWHWTGSAWSQSWLNEIVSGPDNVFVTITGDTLALATSNDNDFVYRFQVQELNF